MTTIEDLRKEIDQKDAQIMRLLNERFELVARLRTLKKTLHDPMREQAILQKAPSKYIQKIYKEIFKNSRNFLETLAPLER